MSLLFGLALAGRPIQVELVASGLEGTPVLGGQVLSDDGQGADHVAGDGVYTAVLSGALGPQQELMVGDEVLGTVLLEPPSGDQDPDLRLSWDGRELSQSFDAGAAAQQQVPNESPAQARRSTRGLLPAVLLFSLALGLVVFAWRRRERRVAFALVPVLVLLGLAELGVRLFAERPSFAAGGPLGWTARPDLDELEVPTADGHFLVSTNEDGLRTELSRERSERDRWVTFGDSTVFGWGVASTDSPAGTLERLVPELEVLNAGQPGYSSEQARRLADGVIPAYRPDRVIWFHPWHDVIAGTPDRDLLPADLSLLDRLLATSALWQTMRQPDAGNSPLFAFEPDYGGTDERVPAEHREDNLRRLDAARRAVDAELVVALLPVAGGGHGHRGLAAELKATCEELGVGFVNLNAEASPAPWEDITVVGDPGHLDAEGNRLYMLRLLEALGESP
ncbi:MAG TPA: SGNH/GDSL hydrolase family protein [Myxococcota bacterium]|nr:SGNH/GDSL hydrolase family protein [Myxococcota bacterium]